MKTHRYFICCILLLIISCSKNDDDNRRQQNSDRPDIPESILYDINEDSVDDFKIDYDYGVWDGAGASGLLYTATFKPNNENKILSEYEENVSTTFLFAELGDSIQRSAAMPQQWYHIGWFSKLYQGGDGVWSKEWQVETKKESAPYYAGVQIMANDSLLLGWLKLKIDKSTGKIDIVEHRLTSEDFIVIGE